MNPEGLGVAERLVLAGYDQVTSSEVMGLAMFRYFLPMEAGVETIFRNMVINDLSRPDIKDTVIFNPVARDMGVSVKTGSMSFGSKPYNVYLAVCDSGLSAGDVNADKARAAIPEITDMLMIMMNQARIKPVQSAENSGMEKAVSEAMAVITPAFFSIAGPPSMIRVTEGNDGFLIYGLQRTGMSAKDVVPLLTRKISVSMPVFTDSSSAANLIFRSVLETELSATDIETSAEKISERIVFNPNETLFTPLMINMAVTRSDKGNPVFEITLSVYPEFKQEDSSQALYQIQYMIPGAIYEDKDLDGLYDAGEGLVNTMKEDGKMAYDIYLPHWHRLTSFDFAGGFMGEYGSWPSAVYVEAGENMGWADLAPSPGRYSFIRIVPVIHE